MLVFLKHLGSEYCIFRTAFVWGLISNWRFEVSDHTIRGTSDCNVDYSRVYICTLHYATPRCYGSSAASPPALPAISSLRRIRILSFALSVLYRFSPRPTLNAVLRGKRTRHLHTPPPAIPPATLIDASLSHTGCNTYW